MASQRLQCPSCGAPMRWKGSAPVVECRYCKSHVNVETEEITEEEAVVRTKVRPRNLLFSWLLVGFIMCTGIVPAMVGLILGPSSSGGMKTVPFETVASVSLASTIGQLAEATDHEAWSDTSLCVYFRGGVFDYVCFGWDEEHPGHVESFNFYCNETNESAEAIKAWLDFYLGPRLQWSDSDGYSMYLGGSHIYTDEELTHMGFHVDPDRDDGWQTRLQWYWAVALASMMGQDIGVDVDTSRQWLGKGYTLAQLGKLDVTDTVDEAQKSVPRRFPGATTDNNGESWEVPVDHPWIAEATFHWDNDEGGQLESVYMTPYRSQEFTRYKTMRNCISKELGKSEHHVTDHLAKEYRYSWEPRGLEGINLSKGGLWVYVAGWNSKVPRKNEWKAVMNRLHDCPD